MYRLRPEFACMRRAASAADNQRNLSRKFKVFCLRKRPGVVRMRVPVLMLGEGRRKPLALDLLLHRYAG